MTVSSEINKSGPYTGNGVTTVFAYGFKIATSGHLKVVKTDTDGVQTVLALDSDYFVTGAGSPSGGNVTLSSPLPAGHKLMILRDVPFVQETDLENQGAYYAETVEQSFDLSVMRDQQLQEQIDRALKVDIGDDPSGLDGLAAAVVTVFENIDDVQAVAAIDADVSAVAAIDADVSVVADNAADVTWLADVYYGPSATDPVTRRDGSALVAGDFYFNTVADLIRIWTGVAWQSQVKAAGISTYQYVATSGQTVFTGADANSNVLFVEAGSLLVTLNGVALLEGGDFTVTDGGDSITLAVAADLSDELAVLSFDQLDFASVILQMTELRDETVAVAGILGSFATRAAFVAAAGSDPWPSLASGQVVVAGGLEYRRSAGETVLADLPGWVPSGDVYIEHAGGGVDALPAQNAAAMEALQSWLHSNGGGVIYLMPGVYEASGCPNTSVYQIGGIDTAASNATILSRPGVRIEAKALRDTTWRCNPSGLGAIQHLLGRGGGVRGVRFEGGWVEGATNTDRSGLITVTEGDFARTNLLAPASFSTTEGWLASGDITLSTSSGRLRATYGATGGGIVYKSFPTVVGQEYRVRATYLAGTTPVETLMVSVATGSTAGTRFLTDAVGFPNSTNYARTMTFTATSTTTFLQFYSTSSNAELIGDYFEVTRLRVCLFPLAEQTLYFRDYWVEDCHFEGFPSYGIGFEDGDIICCGLRRVSIRETGADAFDNKQRGPSLLSLGLLVEDCIAERFGLRADGQAGFDFHGNGHLRNVVVRDFGKTGFQTIGVRFRTLAPPEVPYEGAQAEGSALYGARIYANSVGDAIGVQAGSPNCKIHGVFGEGGRTGIDITGNSYGDAQYTTAEACTWRGASLYSFRTAAEGASLTNCTSFDAGTAGFRNEAAGVTYFGCNHLGAGAAQAHTRVAMIVSGFGETGGGGQFTQITSKTTSVAVTARRGRIVTHNSALGAGASATFRVNLSGVSFPSTDLVLVQSASASYSVFATRNVTNASFDVTVVNETGGSLSDAVSINFSLFSNNTNA